MNRPSIAVTLAGWGVTLAGCAATIMIGANVIAAQALSGLFALFQSQSATAVQSDNLHLIWPLVPAAVVLALDIWILWLPPVRRGGISAWWLVPAFAIAAATLAFGVWVCIDVWQMRPPPPGAG